MSRLVIAVITLVIVSFAVFFATALLPGDLGVGLPGLDPLVAHVVSSDYASAAI